MRKRRSLWQKETRCEEQQWDSGSFGRQGNTVLQFRRTLLHKVTCFSPIKAKNHQMSLRPSLGGVCYTDEGPGRNHILCHSGKSSGPTLNLFPCRAAVPAQGRLSSPRFTQLNAIAVTQNFNNNKSSKNVSCFNHRSSSVGCDLYICAASRVTQATGSSQTLFYSLDVCH